MAAQSTVTHAHTAAPIASPTFINPEIESIIAEASEQGQCSGLMAEVWRLVGERDIHKLRQLAKTAPREDDIEEVEQQLAAFVVGVEKVRTFILAMKLAAHAESRNATRGDAFGLDWATLMDGITDMIPNEESLERSVTNTVNALRTLYWGAGLQAQRMVPPVATQSRRDVVSAAAKART